MKGWDDFRVNTSFKVEDGRRIKFSVYRWCGDNLLKDEFSSIHKISCQRDFWPYHKLKGHKVESCWELRFRRDFCNQEVTKFHKHCWFYSISQLHWLIFLMFHGGLLGILVYSQSSHIMKIFWLGRKMFFLITQFGFQGCRERCVFFAWLVTRRVILMAKISERENLFA